MKLWRNFLVLTVALFSLASCNSDDDKFDAHRLEGTWKRVWQQGVQDAGTEQYTFHPESSYSGTIELTISSMTGQETKDLNFVVGYTAHMNIFTGKKHNSESSLYGEYDIHKLTNSEMVWYRTDSNEELARFKKVK